MRLLQKEALYLAQKDGAYAKILSEFDMERLANPKNDYDQAIFDALDPEVKKTN